MVKLILYCFLSIMSLNLIFLIGCGSKKVNLKYDKLTHVVEDLSGNNIRNVELNELNADSSIACTIYYDSKRNGKGTVFINLENPDTSYFDMNDALTCRLIVGKQYLLELKFLGQADTMWITW